MLKVEYLVGILFDISIIQKPVFQVSSHVLIHSLAFYHIQTPLSCYLSICSNMLRYVLAHSLNIAVVTLTFGSALLLGILRYSISEHLFQHALLYF